MAHHRSNTTIHINLRKPWQVPTGHRQDRKVTTMDSRPKRQRTRQGVDKSWRREYDME